MEYETRNGFNVIKSGWVIIDEEAHFVKNFYVACSAALNQRAWNISSEVKRCPICIELSKNKPQIVIFKSNTMKPTEAFKNTIKSYLDNRASTDSLFANTYAKENKSLDECINYIFETVQKSGCNGFADDEVYSMAVHYYDEDSIKDVKPINAKVVVNHSIPVEKPAKQNPVPVPAPAPKQKHEAKNKSQFVVGSLFD